MFFVPVPGLAGEGPGMESISHVVDCAVKQYSSGGTKKTDRASDRYVIV